MPTNQESIRRILLTGAAGRIGTAFFAETADRYQFRLADRLTDNLNPPPGHEIVQLDIADLGACRAACADIDTVVHLAADPSPEADFHQSLLANNFAGTYNIFRAAKDSDCQRVVFASSVHAIGGITPESLVLPTDPVRPMNMYGVSKCFGENVASYFAHAEQLSSIAIRIGAYEAAWIKDNATDQNLSAFLSKRDMNQLLVRCIEQPDIPFAIVHGISNNHIKRMDLASTRALLGYEPQDDGFAIYR